MLKFRIPGARYQDQMYERLGVILVRVPHPLGLRAQQHVAELLFDRRPPPIGIAG
jgi:hypothetical protein